MKNRINIRMIGIELVIFLGLMITCAGCGTTMDVVEKSLEEGDLVPEQALMVADFLNEYDHHLPLPEKQLLDIDIAFERPNVLATGDAVHVQVGLVSRPPALEAMQFHVLVFNPDSLAPAGQQKLRQTAAAILAMKNKLPKGSALTIDTENNMRDLGGALQGFIAHKAGLDLVHFLRVYARAPLSPGKHHFVLMLAEHNDLSRAEKQDLVDLANILRIKSATLSVLSVGENAQVAFLKALTAKGQGRFNVITEQFGMASWFGDEVRYANALKLRDIRLRIAARNGVTIHKVKSPADYYSKDNVVEKTITELVEGKSYVVLAELNIPSVSSTPEKEVLGVDVEYFDPVKKRYYTLHKTGKVHYVLDRNQTLGGKNTHVARSLLILDTQSVLRDIVPVIEGKRYYHAVSMLTEQSIKLKAFARRYVDKELSRDAAILDKYAEYLYRYDEKLFQTAQIWHDLSWDTRRYAENYQ